MTLYGAFGKRTFDLAASLLGLCLSAPLLLILAGLIKATSRGPAFFIQERVGKEGKLFFLIKFRSMSAGPREGRPQFEPGVSRRVTPLGRFLRKSKLDELPQLINVLIGEMSLVGPRPEVPEYRSSYTGKYGKILDIRPGMTDRASIKYRDEETLLAGNKRPEEFYREVVLPDKLEINLAYAQRPPTFREDLKILIDTLKKALLGV